MARNSENLELFNQIKEILIKNYSRTDITEVIAKELTGDQRHRNSIGILRLANKVYDIYTRKYETGAKTTHFEGTNILWLIMASNLLALNYIPDVHEEKNVTIDEYYKKYLKISKEGNFIIKSYFDNSKIYFEYFSKKYLASKNPELTFSGLNANLTKKEEGT